MVISDCYRYLYFVIPKCGSASVRHAMAPYTDIGYPVTDFEQHVTIEKFLGQYDCENRFERYFKFTFVRNPYDRLYSGFRQDMLASKTWTSWIAAKKPIFDAIGDDFNLYMHEYVAKADIVHAWDWVCFCPMVAFSHLNGAFALDWIGRTEHLERDLHALADKLGIEIGTVEKFNMREPAAGTPEQPKYLSRYNRATVQLVNDLYAEDFAAFDYPMLDPGGLPSHL
ncbi:sulfotransferase family 2 domain-containing protein [Thalassospiraceae bacterium LMO-JJ14]|nr:sulfotransferase family 2 domain-containing protein [Thalassospiraceae bacterium LMO-JJ14]